ncbi:MAG: NapC/NirT family cytochrome c, partial [Armatimonadota bacterium]
MKLTSLKPITVLKTRYRLPVIGRSISVGMTLLLAFVALVGLVISFAATSQPLFCGSCHEMDDHFATWRVSSHKGVTCEQCHMSSGLIGMFKTKIGATRLVAKHIAGPPKEDVIKGHVPDANCKKCHTSTREWVVYHGLQISHKKHWDRGISCTYCHANVVHGPSASTINVPTMEMCFKCHNGKTAPNRCGLCHETLGVRRPMAFSQTWIDGHKIEAAGDRAKCMRCHQQDFCTNCHQMSNPHKADFMDLHAAQYRRDPGACEMCHPKISQKRFCDACHSKKRAHPANFVSVHPTIVKKSGSNDCQACHEKTFCGDCHSRYKPHPADWIQTHQAQAKQRLPQCQGCHKTEFCEACHTKSEPVSHKQAGWLHSHKSVALAGTVNCATCHTQRFCMTCHKRTPPNSHKQGWRKRHGLSAIAGAQPCALCHAKTQCESCHR